MVLAPMSRLFDCFTFSDELDLLSFRLELLSDVVDGFVLVEAPRSFSGQPKPLVFQDNRDRFERYLSKVRHIVVSDLPDPIPTRWIPEAFQRNAVERGLTDARDDDLILVSDVDEIFDP